MNNPWIWRFTILLFAIVLVPTVVIPGAAAMITLIINSLGETMYKIFLPLSQSGDARLEGLVMLCLHLIFIVILIRFFISRR